MFRDFVYVYDLRNLEDYEWKKIINSDCMKIYSHCIIIMWFELVITTYYWPNNDENRELLFLLRLAKYVIKNDVPHKAKINFKRGVTK